MSNTARQEKDMVAKYDKLKDNPETPPLDRLRAHVLSRGVRSLKRLSQAFKRIDVNKDQKIDFDEFRKALHTDGIFVEKDVERAVFDEIDIDGAGWLNFDEFIVALRPPMSSRRMALVHQAFAKLDKSGDGEVTTDDLHGIYDGKKHKKYLSGEMTEEEIFADWLNNFNGPDNFSGVVTMSDFENYYAGVSASIDTDSYFDLMMRKAWKL